MLTAQTNNKLIRNKVKFLGLYISNTMYYNKVELYNCLLYYILLFQSQISYFQYLPNNVCVHFNSD